MSATTSSMQRESTTDSHSRLRGGGLIDQKRIGAALGRFEWEREGQSRGRNMNGSRSGSGSEGEEGEYGEGLDEARLGHLLNLTPRLSAIFSSDAVSATEMPEESTVDNEVQPDDSPLLPSFSNSPVLAPVPVLELPRRILLEGAGPAGDTSSALTHRAPTCGREISTPDGLSNLRSEGAKMPPLPPRGAECSSSFNDRNYGKLKGEVLQQLDQRRDDIRSHELECDRGLDGGLHHLLLTRSSTPESVRSAASSSSSSTSSTRKRRVGVRPTIPVRSTSRAVDNLHHAPTVSSTGNVGGPSRSGSTLSIISDASDVEPRVNLLPSGADPASSYAPSSYTRLPVPGPARRYCNSRPGLPRSQSNPHSLTLSPIPEPPQDLEQPPSPSWALRSVSTSSRNSLYRSRSAPPPRRPTTSVYKGDSDDGTMTFRRERSSSVSTSSDSFIEGLGIMGVRDTIRAKISSYSRGGHNYHHSQSTSTITVQPPATPKSTSAKKAKEMDKRASPGSPFKSHTRPSLFAISDLWSDKLSPHGIMHIAESPSGADRAGGAEDKAEQVVSLSLGDRSVKITPASVAARKARIAGHGYGLPGVGEVGGVADILSEIEEEDARAESDRKGKVDERGENSDGSDGDGEGDGDNDVLDEAGAWMWPQPPVRAPKREESMVASRRTGKGQRDREVQESFYDSLFFINPNSSRRSSASTSASTTASASAFGSGTTTATAMEKRDRDSLQSVASLGTSTSCSSDGVDALLTPSSTSASRTEYGYSFGHDYGSPSPSASGSGSEASSRFSLFVDPPSRSPTIIFDPSSDSPSSTTATATGLHPYDRSPSTPTALRPMLGIEEEEGEDDITPKAPSRSVNEKLYVPKRSVMFGGVTVGPQREQLSALQRQEIIGGRAEGLVSGEKEKEKEKSKERGRWRIKRDQDKGGGVTAGKEVKVKESNKEKAWYLMSNVGYNMI